MPWYGQYVEPLCAVAAATLDQAGTLIDANAGFFRLIATDPPLSTGEAAGHLFIQPTFATLLAAPPDAEGHVHRGLLTIGELMGRTRSLQARVWRVEGRVRLLAEYDVDDLERLYDTVLELNRGYADTHSALARSNLALQQRDTQSTAASLTDPLTGVGNRRRMEQALPVEVGRAGRTGEPLSAIMADLDHFKAVNDTYGHQAGDDVLVAFGALLRQQTRPTDIVARFGGEEFVILLPHTRCDRAVAIAERIREAVAALRLDRLPAPVTGSFGVAELAAGEHGDALLGRADAALYQAKQWGRDRVVRAASQP